MKFMAIEIVSFPFKKWVNFHSYGSLPQGNEWYLMRLATRGGFFPCPQWSEASGQLQRTQVRWISMVCAIRARDSELFMY